MLERLALGFRQRMPLMLQTEAAECGLACLGMIAGYHGHETDLATLRGRFPVSLKGLTLGALVQLAARLELASRPVKLDIDALSKLRLPCILHWEFNHFVVLREVGSRTVTIFDPAMGIRKCSIDEISRSFTGVALELWPTAQFSPLRERRPVRLQRLIGRITGLGASIAHVVTLALVLEILMVLQPFFMQWVIDHVLPSADLDLLTTLAVGFTLLLLMQQVTTVARGWVLMFLGTTLNLQWRSNVFMHLLRLPVTYFEKRHLGDVVSRFGAIDAIQRTLTTSFLEAVLDGLVMSITLAMMFVFSAPLAWIAVGAMALYAFGRWLWFVPLRDATEAQIVHTAKQQTHFLETVRGVKTIKLFRQQDERRSRWLTLLVNQINADLTIQKMALGYRALSGVLFGLETIVIVWLGARFVLGGTLTVGALIAFMAFKLMFDTRVSALLDKWVDVKMMQLQGERLADIVLHAPEPASPATWREAAELSDTPSVPVIEVRNLRFRYSEHEPYVLDGVNLRIEAGESVAITGASGGGKSTLINVLLGILPPTEGEVLLDGVPVGHVGLDKLRRLAGTVLQDDTLFAGTIAENISFFDPHADLAWVGECAHMAAIHDDISAMPMGYNTLVGDMGTVLSGGQKQRVLLARALYKRPSVLFLDEATSHLDVTREREVNAAIARLPITRVIVAHRTETVVTASRELMLDAGRIVRDVRHADAPCPAHVCTAGAADAAPV
ncbi:peptidase domain-containing ABC transporter [Pandoraea sp. CB10b_02]|uniref:peptidase domain-containing ABC transporter n=1 Tax=Pandoraea sp. CB10b_02 TaxID=2014535 RepID=UPI00257BFFC6|nr:peptidase domain-containing ABC transporter [Pandoraea sp. CB10b_02]